ncbi:MAG: glycosyltransferase [Candidatus Paceibacterota bacterium]
MRIIIAADTYYPHINGASFFAQRLAHYLQKNGHIVAVIAPSESFQNTEKKINGISVFGISSLPILFYSGFRFSLPFFIKKEIKKIIKEFQPDIIHVQSHFSICRAVISLAKKSHLPIIATNHFMPENLTHYLHLPAFIENLIKKIAWLDFSRIFNKVDLVTTPTESAAKLIRSRLKNIVKSVSCGIDLNRFNPKNNGDYLKEKYHLSNNKLILLYVGRLDKEKNIDLIIKAVAQVPSNIDLHFVIAGTGAEKENLMNLSEKLSIKERVHLIGFVSDHDLENIYRIAECFIIAGTAELQSIVTLEALASGLPVIAANAVALPELVKDEENGFLFEPGDLDSLIKKIKTIFSDSTLRKKMAEKSLAIIANHSIEKTISQFENIYFEQINRHSHEKNLR